MKKFIILLVSISIFGAFATYANKNSSNHENEQTDIIQNSSAPEDHIAVYKLFPTQNMWTFIKLNTRNGQMWQVQYDINGDNRGEYFLSILPLVSKEKEINGRFTLYPTQNIYNFILLDQIDGKMWQAQWSTKIENRGIIPIE
ncbi:hypothetical protein A3BBH6_26550 [Alistipes onderdonkii subsp. vulgaris]|uniref:hypothetical protein n=1 Tax=Alistipes onderdonkii TaxID=328813 RepID=UPI001164DE43|nr:hypothetical protein [Alistipes onderdonkii]BBL02419.1 hypothetical protein A3BBH6_26550 [Alistipes onderdonkii subsp. vulgaris]